MRIPFFSIVVPTYNRASDLEFALFCIFRQNFKDFEVIISDNCSTDNTNDCVKKFKSKRIHYFRNKKNLDMVLNQKKAIEYAKGKYVFIHSDDDFLPFKNSLEKVYKKIRQNNPGYLRINYLSLSLDRKKIFKYKVNKPFKYDYALKPNLDNEKVLSFIFDSDPYFITGIVFRNNLPRSIKMLNSDPVPWINILFYNTKKSGALFLKEPQIIAYWSRRNNKKNQKHHLFRLFDGRLKAEGYLNAIKEKVESKIYQKFLHKELTVIYVGLLPIIKANVGNKILLSLCKRILILDPSMKEDPSYWFNFILALSLPQSTLFFLKEAYLFLYTRAFSINEESKVKEVKLVQDEYLNWAKKTTPLFQI